MAHALTPEQEAVANRLDTAGLAMIGAGVLGEVLHRHGAPGGMTQRIGKAMHDVGPYTDLAGLALIAPPVMHPLARAIAPDKPKAQAPAAAPAAPVVPDAPRALGEIPVATTMPDEADAAESAARVEPEGRRAELDQAKLASYQHGALAARKIFGIR